VAGATPVRHEDETRSVSVDLKKWVALGSAVMLLVGVFALGGCSSTETDEPAEEPSSESPAEEPAAELEGTINVQGSDTMLNIGTAWSEAFMDENPGVEVSVQGGGSGTGIAALINGTVDLANASRDIKDEEITEAEGKGIFPVEHRVAIDGIAVIVNPANGIDALTMDQLGKIYRGEVSNWKDVGGVDKEIVLLSRDSSSGTYEFFRR
jgi:phosphate transport system substrate-binding protein